MVRSENLLGEICSIIYKIFILLCILFYYNNFEINSSYVSYKLVLISTEFFQLQIEKIDLCNFSLAPDPGPYQMLSPTELGLDPDHSVARCQFFCLIGNPNIFGWKKNRIVKIAKFFKWNQPSPPCGLLLTLTHKKPLDVYLQIIVFA